MILGEIVAQQLERRLGRKVERRFNLGNTLITYQSLQSDQISLYPEYTGMIVTEILKEPPATDASLVFERAKGEMRRIAQSELLDPLGLSNTFTAIISSSDPRAAAAATLSDAAQVSDGWKIAVSYDFQQRADGIPALSQYHLPMVAPLRATEEADLFRLLEQGQASMILASATEGQLASSKWKALRDDRNLFTPEQACILVKQSALDHEPKLRPALAELSGKFTDDKMRQMNAKASLDHQQIADIAREFLAHMK